ncbi:MAG: class I SAM-dependent methyltransferase [Pseudomonadota bacterium]
MNTLPNPKRKRASKGSWTSFFPYYAGFPVEFAQYVLQKHAPPNALVLDPWNGSGTTTFTAALMGLRAIGVDINPVMVVIARARLLQSSESDSLIPLAHHIISDARNLDIDINQDALSSWFDQSTTVALRSIERSIRKHLIGSFTVHAGGIALNHLSSLAAIYYVALFSVARDLARQLRSTNPTWTRTVLRGEQLINCSRTSIEARLLEKIRKTAESLLLGNSIRHTSNHVCIREADVSTSPNIGVHADLILTSPPYCTRIDYTSMTRIEIAILSGLVEIDVLDLKRRMTGTTTVPKTCSSEDARWGTTCLRFLDAVKNHRSYASSVYYYKNHFDYFDKMFRSLQSCRSNLKMGSDAILVIQDSYYKDVHNDLPQIISEMGASSGLKEVWREDFQVPTLATMNPRSSRYRSQATAKESVVCLRAQ